MISGSRSRRRHCTRASTTVTTSSPCSFSSPRVCVRRWLNSCAPWGSTRASSHCAVCAVQAILRHDSLFDRGVGHPVYSPICSQFYSRNTARSETPAIPGSLSGRLPSHGTASARMLSKIPSSKRMVCQDVIQKDNGAKPELT